MEGVDRKDKRIPRMKGFLPAQESYVVDDSILLTPPWPRELYGKEHPCWHHPDQESCMARITPAETTLTKTVVWQGTPSCGNLPDQESCIARNTPADNTLPKRVVWQGTPLLKPHWSQLCGNEHHPANTTQPKSQMVVNICRKPKINQDCQLLLHIKFWKV